MEPSLREFGLGINIFEPALYQYEGIARKSSQEEKSFPAISYYYRLDRYFARLTKKIGGVQLLIG